MFHDHFETEQGNNYDGRTSLVFRPQNIENSFARENSLSMALSFMNDMSLSRDYTEKTRRNTQLSFRASVGNKLLAASK